MTVRVTYHKDKKASTKVSPFAGAGTISQHFEAELRNQVKKIKLGVLAKDTQKEVGLLAKELFVATLKGCKELIEHSGVPAEFDTTDFGANTSVPRRKAGKSRRVRRNLFAQRGSVSVNRRHTSNIKKLVVGGRVIPTAIPVSIVTSWKKLSYEYAKSKPPSEEFFRKRTNPEVSARLDFISKINEAIHKAESSTIYSLPITSVPKQVGDGLLFNFTILYPQIPAPYDFIRKSFVMGAKGSQLDFKTGDNPSDHSSEPLLGAYNRNGILLAERMRPFLRLYAVQMGRKLKDLLM